MTGVGQYCTRRTGDALPSPEDVFADAGRLFFAHSAFAFSITDSFFLYSEWTCDACALLVIVL